MHTGATAHVNQNLYFPGFDEWIPKPGWQPHQPTLEKLKSYLLGFPAHGKTIFPKRKYIADQIGIKVRTLARYLKHLVDAGWLATIARKAHYAIRVIVQAVTGVGGPSRGPCIEVTSEEKPLLVTEVLYPIQVCSDARERDTPRPREQALVPQRTKPNGFQQYLEVFWGAHKPLSETDAHWAETEWKRINPDFNEQIEIVRDAVRVCREASEIRFIPMPASHLRSRAWTRVVAPGPITVRPETRGERIQREAGEIFMRAIGL